VSAGDRQLSASVASFEPDFTDAEALSGATGHERASHQRFMGDADKDSRETRLTEIIAQKVIPALLSHYAQAATPESDPLHPSADDIVKLGDLILGPDNADALDYLYALRDRGISLDRLHLELLEPTARHLGELWHDDQIDFIAVTIGIGRLQRLMHYFADLDRLEPYDEKRRALIMVTPGDDHSFGNSMVQKFLKAAGWAVFSLDGKDSDALVDFVSREWLSVVGFSMSGAVRIDDLASAIRKIRAHSINPHVGIMVGGSIFGERPELVTQVGADGTAANAAAAVILAKKLLAQGLLAAAEAETR